MQPPAYATQAIPQTYPGGNAPPPPDEEQEDDALDPFDADRFHPDVLRAAKHGLMAALIAETPREFIQACTQACGPMIAVGSARSFVSTLRSFLGAAGAVADGLMDEVDPAAFVSIAEAFGIKGEALDQIKAYVADYAARKAAEKAAGPYRCGTVGCFTPMPREYAGVVRGTDHDGVTAIIPHSTIDEYADRTEVRVGLKGADPAKVKCTKSNGGYFVEAPTSLPVVAFASSILGGGAMPTGTVLMYRGTIPMYRSLCNGGVDGPTGEPTVTWDAATESLVITFARANVVAVKINVPPTVADPISPFAPAGDAHVDHAIEMMQAIMDLAEGVGYDVPGGSASDAEGKATELNRYIATLNTGGLRNVLRDLVQRTIAAYPEREAAVIARVAAAFTPNDPLTAPAADVPPVV